MDNADRLSRANAAFESGDFNVAIIDTKAVLQNDPSNRDARVLLGRAALAAGDAATAEKELRRAIDLGAPVSELVIDLGTALLMLGQHEEHLASIDIESAANDEDRRILQLQRGESLLALSRYDQAERLFDTLLDQDRADVRAMLGRALTLNARGLTKDALVRLREITEVSPDTVEAWLGIGELESRRGNMIPAELAYQRAVATSRNSGDSAKIVLGLVGLAEAQLAQGKLEQANSAIAELESEAPGGIFSLLLRARHHLQVGELDQAFDSAQALLGIAPEYPPGQLLMGVVQLQRGKLELAEMHLTSAVAGDPENIESKKALARTYLRMARPEDATRILSPLLGGGNVDPAVIQLLLSSTTASGEQDLVFDYLGNQIEQAPDDASRILDLAAAYLSSGRIGEARRLIEEAPASSDEDRFRGDLMRVLTTLTQDGTDAAIETVQELVVSWPNNVRVRIVQARLLAGARRFEESLSALASAESVDPGNPAITFETARVNVMKGDYDTAATIYESLITEGTASRSELSIYLMLARLAEARGQRGESADWLSKARTLLPDNPGARARLASMQLSIDDAEGAERTLLDDGDQVDLQDIEAALVLARIRLQRGDTDAALRLARDLQSQHDSAAMPHAFEAEILANSGDALSAYAAMRLASDLDPSNQRYAYRAFQLGSAIDGEGYAVPLERYVEANESDTSMRRLLAFHFMGSDDTDAASREYERLLEEDPGDAISLNNLAWIRFEQGDAEALELARRAYSAMPESPSIIDTLGWMEIQLGEFDKGRSLLEEAFRLNPDNGEIAYHLAVVYSRSGDSSEAKSILERALSADGTFSSVTEARELLESL